MSELSPISNCQLKNWQLN